MNNKNENHTLLKTLKELYNQLGALMTKIRFRSYRTVIKSDSTFNITSILNNQVEKLASESVITTPHIEPNEIIMQQPKGSLSKLTIKDQSDMEHKNVSGAESDFAKHLKLSKSSAVNHSYMGDKLKESAWEHIHSAIRFAKQGQVDKAKVHADIAGHAIEEAGHYLNHEEYSALVNRIEDYFTNSKKDKKKEM